jgi:hypothetical protein
VSALPNAVGSPGASRTALENLAWLSDDAYAGDPEHSLLANLRALLAGSDRWPYD